MMTQEIVRLERSQLTPAAEVLAQAFNQDPMMQYFYPVEDQARLNSLQWLSTLILQYCHPYHQIYTTRDELKGIAAWLPPEQFPMNNWRLVQLGFLMFPFKLQPLKIWDFLSLFNQMEHYHVQDMPEPHWYLIMLGVLPTFQGQKVGSALIQPILQKADQEGLPCYLETSTDRGVNFYQSHGFEIIQSGQLPNQGPRYWTMKRSPQS